MLVVFAIYARDSTFYERARPSAWMASRGRRFKSCQPDREGSLPVSAGQEPFLVSSVSATSIVLAATSGTIVIRAVSSPERRA